MKTCSKCKTSKRESEFAKCLSNKDGLQYVCRECRKAIDHKRYLANPDVMKAASRERNRLARLNDPDKVREKAAMWRHSNPDKMKGYARESHKKHREERLRQSRLWRKNNRDLINRRIKQRYANDARFKIRHRLACRLRRALEDSGSPKSAKASQLLGCPVVWLERHLESLFKPGMSWENHGPVWHIDHIKPCALFDLTDPEQQKICFHWTNLQPLFARENIVKGAKYNG